MFSSDSNRIDNLVPVRGIEPRSEDYKAPVIPLYYTGVDCLEECTWCQSVASSDLVKQRTRYCLMHSSKKSLPSCGNRTQHSQPERPVSYPLDERSKAAAHKVNYSLVGHCLETDTPVNYSIVSKLQERLFWTGFEPATV